MVNTNSSPVLAQLLVSIVSLDELHSEQLGNLYIPAKLPAGRSSSTSRSVPSNLAMLSSMFGCSSSTFVLELIK